MLSLAPFLRQAGAWRLLEPWIREIACTDLPGLQCRLVEEAPNLLCLELSAFLEHELPLGSFQAQFTPAFDPSFHWAPHLTPEPGDVIDMHVFRTPALIVACAGRALSLLPDVDHLGGPGNARTFMDMDAQNNACVLGLTTTRIREHVLYQRTDQVVLSPGPFQFRVRLLLQQEDDAASNPFRAVLAYYWQRYGSRQLHLLAPLDALPAYVQRTYDWAFHQWRDRVWQEFTLDGVTVGAPQFIVTVWQSHGAPGGHDIREHVSIWNQAWFCSLRSAMGVFRYAQRTGNASLMACALKTKELALRFPQENGLFDSVIAVPDIMVEENGRLCRRGAPWSEHYFGNSDRNPYGLPIAQAPRHILDMSWTALHMVRWYQELEKDHRLLDYALRYADRLLTLQDKAGYFPAWLQTDASLPILAQSPESAASATFLLELYQATGNDAYRSSALRCIATLVNEVLPSGRWEDFETYWSCSRWGCDTQVGRQVPRNKQFKQCTLSMFYLAEALLRAYEVTGCQRWLRQGERCLDELLMAQSSFQPGAMPVPVVGGFGVMNADAELNDARQSLFSEVILRYGHLLGRKEYLERGEAALRASFSMMYCPENPQALEQWQLRWPFLGADDYGFMMENYGHDGRADDLHTGIGEFTIYDWGNGAASEAVMRIMDHGTATISCKGVFLHA